MPYVIKKEGNLKIIYLKTRPVYFKNDYRRFLNMINFACVLSRVSKRIRPLPDVIIASYPSPFAAVAAYRLAIRYNARFILEIRDLWPQVWVEQKAFSKYHPFIVILYTLEKYLYRRTRFFVTALPYVSDYLKERGIKAQKLSWIPNGINSEDFKAAEKLELSFDCHASDGNGIFPNQNKLKLGVYLEEGKKCLKREKGSYIHYNPVKRSLVDQEDHWIYSSATNFRDKGRIELDIIET